MKLKGPAYPVPGDAVEDVDYVQRHGQRHVTTSLDPLDQEADTLTTVTPTPLVAEATRK